ncbi:MAG: hypothetical protein V4687_01080 [Bacteroidota bacterium]
MKIFSLQADSIKTAQNLKPIHLLILTAMLYFLLQQTLQKIDPAAGYVDPSMLSLVIIGMFCFQLIFSLSLWIHKKFWSAIGLPDDYNFLSHFKQLSSCQQFVFYFASFALLVLAAVGCLIAIC